MMDATAFFYCNIGVKGDTMHGQRPCRTHVGTRFLDRNATPRYRNAVAGIRFPDIQVVYARREGFGEGSD